MLARDLYRLRQEVERLEKELEETAIGNREGIREQLRKTRAERNKLVRILEGAKEPSPYRQPF